MLVQRGAGWADWGTRNIRAHRGVSHGDAAEESCFFGNYPQLCGQDSGDSGQISCCGRGGLQEEPDPTKESGVRKGPILAGAWGRSRAPRDIRAGAQIVATVASPPFPQPSAVFRLHSGAVQRQPCLYSSPTS